MTISCREASTDDVAGKMHVDDIYLHYRGGKLCRNALLVAAHTTIAALRVDPEVAEGEVTTATAIEGRGGTRGGEQVVSYIKRAGIYMSEFCLSRTPPTAPTRED
jgi:hypothetical protein